MPGFEKNCVPTRNFDCENSAYELADMTIDSVGIKISSARLCQSLNLRVLWLATAWGLALAHKPSASVCFLLLGIVGTKFTFRSHRVSVVGTFLGLMIFLHPFLGMFFKYQPHLWSQDWLMSSLGFGILIFVLTLKRQHVKFDSSIKYIALATFGFALIALVALMTLETRLWVLGAGYDNSTHFRDMFASVAQPTISIPFPSRPPMTFAIVSGLFLRILGVSSDTATSNLLSWYLTSFLALTAAFIYASAKVIAKNLQSKILLFSGVVLLVFFICLTPISQTFVSGNPTQVFSLFLVLYYLWPALLSQTRFSVNTLLIIGSLYLVNSSYPFTLILLAPVVAMRFLDLIINYELARNRQRKVQSRKTYSGRRLLTLITAPAVLFATLFWLVPNGPEFFSRSWNQFMDRFSLAGGIEPYKPQVSYAIAYLLSGLLFANLVIYRFRNRIDSTLHRFRENAYMSAVGIGGLLMALLISHYSETITEGGTYYAMKLSYSAAIIALVGAVAIAISLVQALIAAHQRQKLSLEKWCCNRSFLLGLLVASALLVSGGFVLHRVSSESPRAFQRAYMGTIPNFISEFNNPGSSGIDSRLVAYATQVSEKLKRPVFLVTGGTANTLGTIWVNEISGFWSYRLWESINHVPPALSVGDVKTVADFFEDLKMILITDDETLLIKLRSEVPILLGCTVNEIHVGTCELQRQNPT
jgi:hypothetical protein